MSHVMEKPVCVNMSYGWVGSSDPAGACAVFGYYRGRGTRVFTKPGPYFSVYGVILYVLFVNCRHWGLRQRRFPPPVPIEAQQRWARTQMMRAAWRNISQKSRAFNPGTKGVPSISILVISRGYHQLPRYRENSAQTLFKQS